MKSALPAAKDGPRINEEIRSREVQLIDTTGHNHGPTPIQTALEMAQTAGLDLVEIAPNSTPPVVKILDYGKYKFQAQKKAAEARKKQKVVEVKEIKLRPMIDDHDYQVKMRSMERFFEEGDKVKITLRFRGREMAHQEIGFQVVKKFVQALVLYGHPDAEPKLIGRGIHVMVSPLPRNKRAKNPNQFADAVPPAGASSQNGEDSGNPEVKRPPHGSKLVATNAAEQSSTGFANNPFSKLDAKVGEG